MATDTKQEKPDTKQDKPERLIIQAYHIEPPVGWPVLWFANGDRQQAGQACLAVQCNGRGVIGLWGMSPAFQQIRQRTVPWIGDPRVRDKPDFAAETGAWDWVPGLVPEQYQRMAPEEPTILMLYKQGRLDARAIAEWIGGDWSIGRVNGTLQKHHALDSQQK